MTAKIKDRCSRKAEHLSFAVWNTLYFCGVIREIRFLLQIRNNTFCKEISVLFCHTGNRQHIQQVNDPAGSPKISETGRRSTEFSGMFRRPVHRIYGGYGKFRQKLPKKFINLLFFPVQGKLASSSPLSPIPTQIIRALQRPVSRTTGGCTIRRAWIRAVGMI